MSAVHTIMSISSKLKPLLALAYVTSLCVDATLTTSTMTLVMQTFVDVETLLPITTKFVTTGAKTLACFLVAEFFASVLR